MYVKYGACCLKLNKCQKIRIIIITTVTVVFHTPIKSVDICLLHQTMDL